MQLTIQQQKIVDECNKVQNAIIEIPTGTGKTFIAIDILKNSDAKTILIIVNTIHLKNQWVSILTKERILQDKSKIIVVATIQSAYKYEGTIWDLLIGDEAHHIFSPLWINLLKNNKFKKILLLTATLERDDKRHLLASEFNFKIINNLSYNDGIKEKLISKFEVKNIAVNLNEHEKNQYDKISDFITKNFSQFNYNYLNVKSQIKNNVIAQELMRCFVKRKFLLNSAFNKLDAVINILEKNTYNKCLIYNEYIDFANSLSIHLENNYFDNKLYHSKIKNKENILKDFKDSKFKILIAVKALDEGLDVPSCDMGIIVSSSSQPRQTIQRIGRILRYQENKTAKIFNLYVERTKEEQWLKNRMSSIMN